MARYVKVATTQDPAPGRARMVEAEMLLGYCDASLRLRIGMRAS